MCCVRSKNWNVMTKHVDGLVRWVVYLFDIIEYDSNLDFFMPFLF